MLAVTLALSEARAESLAEVASQALATHPEILDLVHERQIRDQFVEEGRAGYRPHVDFIGNVGREWTRSPTTRAARRAAGLEDNKHVALWRRQALLDARQLIYDGQGTPAEVQRRLANADSTAYLLQSEAERVTAQVAGVYLEVLRDRELLGLSRQNLLDHQRIHDQIRQRSESGVGRQADFDQADARLALAESNVVSSEASLEDTLASYARAVGAEAPAQAEPVVNQKTSLPESIDAALDIALATHPMILASEADLAAAEELIRVARSRLQPRLELQLAGRYGDDLNGTEGFDQDWMAMLNAEYNLYNGGADMARIARSKALLKQVQDNRESALREVTESLRLAWTALHAAERQRSTLERRVQATEKARDAYRQQFNLGDRSLLDLLDSENELFETRRALVEARADYDIAFYRTQSGLARLVAQLGVTLPPQAEPLQARQRTN
jgi:adhesin transport system outer membrane protein